MNEVRYVIPQFVQIWNNIFGIYEPITVDNGETFEFYTDFGYIFRVVFFIVVVYCILRIIGGFIRGKQ